MKGGAGKVPAVRGAYRTTIKGGITRGCTELEERTLGNMKIVDLNHWNRVGKKWGELQESAVL